MKLKLTQIVFSLFFFNILSLVFAQQPDSTKPLQISRGIPLQEGNQSYDEYYSGKDMLEEKRSHFPLSGTGTWTELNPKVPRVDYVGLDFINPDTGWAVGDLGALIKTTDGGENWSVIETNTTSPILRVRSYNGQTVIACGYDGLILRSTDGGETFTQVISGLGNGFDLWGLEMINDTLGWACGATALLKTTDGGENWQIVNTPGYTGNLWWIDFMNKSYGFVAADGKVLRTSDGGSNWEIIQAGDSAPLYCIDVIDSLHIAAGGYGGTNYSAKNLYSSDGGNNWIIGDTLTTEEVNCIQYLNPDTGYVVMNNVIGFKTTNRGQQWTGIAIGGEWEMQFLKEKNMGYSAGSELRVYKTENGYENWQRLIINDNFSDVFFVNEQKGFAISSYGLSNSSGLYKTGNGGINWERVAGAPDGVDLLFLDSLTGFIGGSNAIYKTTDGGDSWYATIGTTGAGKIFFIDSTVGWAVHSRSIYKTTDTGENWIEQITLPADSYTSIFFIDSLNGWATSRYIWQTTDGGENWIERADIPAFFSQDVYFNDSIGFIIDFLTLYKSTDSGSSWFIQINSPYIIKNFGWMSDNHGFIMGGSVVYETTDSGGTWNLIDELNNVGLQKFHSPKNYSGYSIGSFGLIYKYVDTTLVPVELTSFFSETNNDIVLLRWSTSTETNNSGFAVLRSTDNQNWKSLGFINGNGTTTLVHHYQFADQVEISGIYYYKLKQIDYSGDFHYSNIIEVSVSSPFSFELSQNFPNPFNPTTKISFEIPIQSEVRIILYDITGQEIKTITNQKYEAGFHSVLINAGELSSGVYLYRMTTQNGYTAVKKLTIIK